MSQPLHTSQPPCSSDSGQTKPGGWWLQTLGLPVPSESSAGRRGQDPLSKRPPECGCPQTWPVPNLNMGSDVRGALPLQGVLSGGALALGNPPTGDSDLGWEPPEPPRWLRRLHHTFSLSHRDSPELLDVNRGDGSGRCCPWTRCPALGGLVRGVRSQYPLSIYHARSRRYSVKFYARLRGDA